MAPPKGVPKMANFIRELIPLLDDSFSPKNRNATELQIRVDSNRDRFLPFRESAPSRIATRDHPSSPFQPDVLLTRAGFFSALVFRGITQAAPVVTEHGHVFFKDLDDFNEVKGDHDEKWMCNSSALGPPNKNRTTANAPGLWDASIRYHRLHAVPLMSFRQCFDFIRLKFTHRGKKYSFRGYGPLTAYLLCVDFAYSEVIQPATVHEMGLIVGIIDRGAVAGLRRIGALPEGKLKVTPQRCVDAFQEIYQGLEEELAEEEKETIGFDVFVLEHSLCKVARLRY